MNDAVDLTTEQLEQETSRARDQLTQVRREIGKAIVGHEELVDEILVCLLSRGHALLEGVPGLGKTFLIRTVGQVLDLHTRRIQFTPDLMPADILGTNVLVTDNHGSQEIQFQKGPVFSQVILADEINRATPKTQSALLEAMQEQRVTIGGITYPLELPFMVLATQNPIEMEGTYPLPEAQMDRFFFKLRVRYPSREEMTDIVNRTTGTPPPQLERVMDAPAIMQLQQLVRALPVAQPVTDYVVRLIYATHPQEEASPEVTRTFVRYGASPRGAQSLILAGKVFALMAGRSHVSFEDIRRALFPALRHRIILNFHGEAEGMTTEAVVTEVAGHVKEE